jgi:hypothetical protein
MKVKALTIFAHASGKAFAAGKEYEVADALAAEFIRGELVEEVKPEEKKVKAEK